MQVFYTVNQGDTLWTISHRWQIPLNSLISANNLTKPYDIVPGQQLSMPPGVTTYTVKLVILYLQYLRSTEFLWI